MSEKKRLTTKEFMQRYQNAKRKRSVIVSQLVELRMAKMYPSLGENDGMPHGTDMRDLSDYSVQVEKLEQKLMKAEKKCIEVMEEIIKVINRVEDVDQQKVLSLRYVSGLLWEEIAERMSFTERRIHQIHGAALQAVEKLR